MGRPILAKSANRYPPGPYIIIWVGEPIGVAKLEETAIINAMQNVSGFTCILTAVWNVIGKKMAAFAAEALKKEGINKVGLQAFKMMQLAFLPFGADIPKTANK